MKKTIFCVLLLLLVVSMCNFTQAEDIAYRLPVFETSDVHGYIAEQVDDDNYNYLLAYVSDKVKDVRGYGENHNDDYAILLDGGDIFQGSIMSNLLNGAPISVAYEVMGYDAVVIGNHEFDWGITNVVDSDATMMDSSLDGFEITNDVPVLACNLLYNGQKVEWAKDYVIFNKTARSETGEELTVRIAVIGYIDNYATSIKYPLFTGAGYSIVDDIGIPYLIAKNLKETNQCDVVIMLCHADARETASLLPCDAPIDLVFGGHTHKNECGVTSSGILFMQPDKYGNAYCYLEFVFTKGINDKSVLKLLDAPKVVSVSDNKDKLLAIAENEAELDQEMILNTNEVIERVQNLLDEKIGYITCSAKKKEFIEGSGDMATTGGNWMSSIYLRALEADVAFVNRGGVRYDFNIPEGESKKDVSLGELYSTYPFGDELYKYEITYDDLFTILSYSLKDEDKKSITSLTGIIDCYYIGEEIQALVKDGELIYYHGEWIGDWKDKTLFLATNDFVATSELEFQGIRNPLIEWNKTSRLVEHDKIDIDCAIEILVEEAIANDGLLYIDTKPHFIEGDYISK